MTGTLYAAYGSNLNRARMAARCPTARVVGAGAIKDRRLLFRGSRAGAVATVEPCKGDSVPVLVWSLTPADEAALDRYEGFPTLYRKEKVSIRLDGKSVRAMIYVMNEGYAMGQPGALYYSIIRDGYKEAGFDLEVLRRATVFSAETDATATVETR